jgi:ribosomal protein L11 methyltransferase
MGTQAQFRLYAVLSKDAAQGLYDRLEIEFEEDGYPVALTEIDEKSAIFEVSLYPPAGTAQTDYAQMRMQRCMDETTARTAVEREQLPDIDWVTKSLEGLSAVRAGRFIVHGSHQRGIAAPHETAIEIEAGRAFGTGHHATTAGCLEMIEKLAHRKRPRSMLDLGAGSAVLAIAAARLLHIPALATDIDPVATQVARRNVRLNAVQNQVRCETATGLNHRAFAEYGPFDLIVANILPRPLMRMAPHIAHALAPGGNLILSGILATQRYRVLSAFQLQGLHHVATLERDDWVTLHLDRGQKPVIPHRVKVNPDQ